MQWWQLAVLIVIGADLLWANWGLNPTSPDEFYTRDYSISAPDEGRVYWFEGHEATIKFDTYFDLSDYRRGTDRWTDARTSLLPNLNVIDRVALFNNFDPLQPDIHLAYIALIEDAQTQAGALLRAAGVSITYGSVQPEGWERGRSDTVYVAPTPTPTVWAVSQAVGVASNDDATAMLMNPSWNPEQVVILQDYAPPEASQAPLTTADVQVISNDPTRRQYRVNTDGAGFLVLASTWYPGWQARVNGDVVDLYRANLAFLAIPISAGDSEVTLTYSPRGGEVTLAISLLSVLILISMVAIGLFNSSDDESSQAI